MVVSRPVDPRPGVSDMNVSVVIPHFGSDETLAPTLRVMETLYPDVELVVVDGNEQNDGFAGNCNRGARQASGELLVFLNNDCRPEIGWLEGLVAKADVWPVVGSLLKYPDGRIQHAGVNLIRLPGGLVAKNITNYRPSGNTDAVTGASLATQSDVFAAVGGFDEGYWNGYEDVDLCLAVTEHTGRRPWMESTSRAVHLESVSGPERWTKVRENEQRLNAKWGND